jgi:hypothetical protein
MAPTTRLGSPQKGKERQVPGAMSPELEPSPSLDDSRQFDQGPTSGPPQSPSTLDLHVHIMALQQAQVNSQLEVQQQKQQLSNMEKTLNGMMALLQTQTQTQRGPTETVLPTRETPYEVRPSVERPSVAPSSSSQGNPNYRAKARDPLRFTDNDGEIEYTAWKELVLDKFEIDQEQFLTARSLMSYVFNHTGSEAQKHLYPRYSRNANNADPYTSYHEMLVTLDDNYLNPHLVRDSRNAYKELKMGPTQSFQAFKTQFLELANAGQVPRVDRFDDMYDKITTALQGQLLNRRDTFGEDFETLCRVALGIDVELKRLNARRNKERESRMAAKSTSAPAPARNFVARPPVLKDTGVGFSLLRRPLDAPKPALALPTSALIKCYNCGEAGHVSKDCKRPKNISAVDEIEEDEMAEFEAVEYPADDPVKAGKDDA